MDDTMKLYNGICRIVVCVKRARTTRALERSWEGVTQQRSMKGKPSNRPCRGAAPPGGCFHEQATSIQPSNNCRTTPIPINRDNRTRNHSHSQQRALYPQVVHEVRDERDRGCPAGEEQEKGPATDDGRRGNRVGELRPKPAGCMRERVDRVREVVRVFHLV